VRNGALENEPEVRMSSFPEEWVNEQPEGEEPLGEEAGLESVGEELGLDDDDQEDVPREEDERLR
jgi:hypothetical protein